MRRGTAGMARSGLVRWGAAWQVWRGKAWPIPARHGKAWQARLGEAWNGGVRQVRHGADGYVEERSGEAGEVGRVTER